MAMSFRHPSTFPILSTGSAEALSFIPPDGEFPLASVAGHSLDPPSCLVEVWGVRRGRPKHPMAFSICFQYQVMVIHDMDDLGVQ